MVASFGQEWYITETARFVIDGAYKRVALQLPDELLWFSPTLVSEVKPLLPSSIKVAVLADTAFAPEAVDEVAAQHMDADCIIHYGPASMSLTAGLPVLYVFPHTTSQQQQQQQQISQAVATCIQQLQPGSNEGTSIDEARQAVVFMDYGLLHHRSDVLHSLSKHPDLQGTHVVVAEPDLQAGASIAGFNAERLTTSREAPSNEEDMGACATSGTRAADSHRRMAGYRWHTPPQKQQQQQQDDGEGGSSDVCGQSQLPQPAMIWVGPADSKALQILQLAFSTADWAVVCVDTALPCGGQSEEGAVDVPVPTTEYGIARSTSVLLKRRAFLIEKARQAALIGILVGTLSCGGSLQPAIAHLRALVSAAGKKSYTVLVGKPNPAKLANFPEVEVWIQLSDSQAAILDSRDYMAPLITPQEAVTALTGEMMLPGQALCLGLEPLTGDEASRQQQIRRARAAYGMQAPDQEEGDDGVAGNQLALTHAAGLGLSLVQGGNTQRALVAKAESGAEFLSMRTWQGVEAPVAGADRKEAEAAVEGLRGRAAVYSQEK